MSETARKKVIKHECEGTGCCCNQCQKDHGGCCSSKTHRHKGCPIHECKDFVPEVRE